MTQAQTTKYYTPLLLVFFSLCFAQSACASQICLNQVHQIFGTTIQGLEESEHQFQSLLSTPVSKLGIELDIKMMKKEIEDFLNDLIEIRGAKTGLDDFLKKLRETEGANATVEDLYPGPLDLYFAVHENRINQLRVIVDKYNWMGSQILDSNTKDPNNQFRYQPTWPQRYRMILDLDVAHLNFVHTTQKMKVETFGDALDFVYRYLLIGGFGLSTPVHSSHFQKNVLVKENRELLKKFFMKTGKIPWVFGSSRPEDLQTLCHSSDTCPKLSLVNLSISKLGEIPASTRDAPNSIWKSVSFGGPDRSVLYPGLFSPERAFWHSLEAQEE